MAYLQSVAAGILKEYCVVSWLVLHRTFDVASPGTPRDFCQPFNLALALRPKSNPVLVRDMAVGLGYPEELGDVIVRGLELQPALDPGVSTEAQSGQ